MAIVREAPGQLLTDADWTDFARGSSGSAPSPRALHPRPTVVAERTTGARITQIGFPAINHIKGTPDESGSGWTEALFLRVPIDDEHHFTFNVSLVHLVGDAAEAYRQRRAGQLAASSTPTHELADQVLRGQLDLDQVPKRVHIVVVQDEVTQRGQGAIADRSAEQLARSDMGALLLRQLWMRELRAPAEGRPLTAWRYSEKLEVTGGGDRD